MAVTEYTWNPLTDSVIEETDGAGNVLVEYTNEPAPYGPLISERRGGQSRQYHFDALGSTRALTDDSQTITDTFAYDAWGNQVAPSATIATPFRWAGEYGCLSGSSTPITYARYRSFLCSTARWSSLARTAPFDSLVQSHYSLIAPLTTPTLDNVLFIILQKRRVDLTAKAFKKECTACGEFSLWWELLLAKGAPVGESVIVQKICVNEYEHRCRESKSLQSCCVPITLVEKSCCYYEKLGTLTPGGLTTWMDIWQGGGGEANRTCVSYGATLQTGDARVFFTKKREVLNARWNKGGLQPCGNGLERVSDWLPAGPNDPVPKWWNDDDGGIFSLLFVAWNCCSNTLRGARGFYYSTGGDSGVLDCKLERLTK